MKSESTTIDADRAIKNEAANVADDNDEDNRDREQQLKAPHQSHPTVHYHDIQYTVVVYT